MATAPSMRTGGARVYSQSGDIDQLLEDAWVTDSRGRHSDRHSAAAYPRHADVPATEKERVLMAQLAEAQRQLKELGRHNWGYDSGSNSRSSGRDGRESDRSAQPWNSDRMNAAPARYQGDHSYPHDSWDDSHGSSDSRSLNTYSGHESPEPLYVNTDVAAAAARAPTPPPRTRFTPPATGVAMAANALPAAVPAAAPTKAGAGGGQSTSYHGHNEKASSSQREASVEVKESVSVFQVFPPTNATTAGSRSRRQPQPQSQPQPQPQPRPQPQPQQPPQPRPQPNLRMQPPLSTNTQPLVINTARDGRPQNFPASDGAASPGVFRFPPPNQQASTNHQSSSSSRRTESFQSHHKHPRSPTTQHHSSHEPSGGANAHVIGHEWSESSVTNRNPGEKSHHHHDYRSETAHMSSNSHSVTHQRKEASSNSERQSQGVSDVYSETTSLQPIGPGIQTLQSHTALHKLRQATSGFQIGNNRVRTLNLSTPQLDQTAPAAPFRSDQQLSAHGGVGALRAATLQASAMEPRSSFLRASSNHQQQHQQQLQQQQHLQLNAYNESTHHSGRMQVHSPGSITPTRRLSGGSFDYDPPSPGGLLRFENDTSQLWYMPRISREEAIVILRPLPPGRFVVRDSTSFPGAYGLAVKVAEVPPGTAAPGESASEDELVRHFLIEQTSRGVRIRGCANEPVFASLAALIYQHTVTPLALPCKLVLPAALDLTDSTADITTAAGAVDPRIILEHGAACNVLYLGATDIESLTGAAGLARAVDALLKNQDRLRSCVCQLKVAKDGISLTDTARRQFFRKHYPTACVLHCAMDPAERSFNSVEIRSRGLARSKIFGFVARKNPGSQENTAVVMCEIEEHQPAEAVVKFVCKYLIGGR